MEKRQKPKKIAEIKLSIYDTGMVTGEFVEIHSFTDIGKKKVIVSKSDFLEHLTALVPAIDINKIIPEFNANELFSINEY